MPSVKDGPASTRFTPLAIRGNATLGDLVDANISEEMREASEHAPSGDCVCWGIPFRIDDVVVIADAPTSLEVSPTRAEWLVFLHTSDMRPVAWNEHGFVSPMRGQGQLKEHAADYVVVYQDGTEERAAVRRRHHLGAFQRRWGENCFEAVAHRYSDIESTKALRRRARGRIFFAGAIVAVLFTIPIVNFFAPIIAPVAMIHIFKGLRAA